MLFQNDCGDACFPPQRRIAVELLVGISDHVITLTPIYQFAKKKVQWQRAIEQLYENGKMKCMTPGFDDMMTFMDGVLSAIERAKQHHLEHLIVCYHTRTFVLKTLRDALLIAVRVLEDTLLGSNGDVFRRVSPVAEQFDNMLQRDKSADLDILLRQSPTLSEFRRSKYDVLRSRLVRVSMYILRIAYEWDNMHSSDLNAKEQKDQQLCALSRFYLLPRILMKLNLLIKVTFGPDDIMSSLLQQLLVVQMDLDIADNY
jgi:hypothetical protein